MTGFFDEFKDVGGGEYVDADEKAVLVDHGIPVTITQVVYQEESKFGERYVLKVQYEDDEGPQDKLMSFGKGTVESRDRMLHAMEQWLDDPMNDPPVVVIEKVGRPFILRPYVPEEKPKPKAKPRAKAAK